MNILSSSVQNISGIGPKYSFLLSKYNIFTFRDLLFTLPNLYTQIPIITQLNMNNINEEVAIRASIIRVISTSSKRYILECKLENQLIRAYFFTKPIRILYKPNTKIILWGKVSLQNNVFEFSHPKWSLTSHKDQIFEIHYASGIPSYLMKKAIPVILDMLALKEWIPQALLQKYQWPNFKTSMQVVHGLIEEKDVNIEIAKQRLAFDESFAYHLSIQKSLQNLDNNNYKVKEHNIDNIICSLPYKLTSSQNQAWQEIKADLHNFSKMVRLLYGEVGSGKTCIAMLAATYVYKNNQQVALMVPTEILAQQHYNSFQSLIPDIPMYLLTRTIKNKAKILKELETKSSYIVIGTHALLQQKINMQNLGLIIIDEQHRFGVLQRALLDFKSNKANILLISATPIPRTLRLGLLGSVPISYLTDMPHSNPKPKIEILDYTKISTVLDKMHQIISNEQAVFWVCSLINDSNTNNNRISITQRFEFLQQHFSNKVRYIHGQMKAQEKESTMQSFMLKEFNILLSTTVIEVGVHVPHATLIVIDNSEHFGLAQLYQLQGRVGRANIPGTCILLKSKNISSLATKRLQALQNSKSGIELAQQDMYIRGFGDLCGTQQSGNATFRCIDLNKQSNILQLAYEHATKTDLNQESIFELIDLFGNLHSFAA